MCTHRTQTDESRLHVGLIMDGNGRWALARGLPRVMGHKEGINALWRACEAAPGLGIETLTVYAFSSDNWQRPAGEVSALMSLLRGYLETECERLVKSGVRLSVIGRRDRLPDGLADVIERAEEATRHARSFHLRVAIDYSGRDAIVRASTAASCQGNMSASHFGELVKGSAGAGDVDLIIRTSGEQRLSDFLLWESAYAELYFTETLWPDFGGPDLEEALTCFRKRKRRFGGRPEEVVEAGRAPSPGVAQR